MEAGALRRAVAAAQAILRESQPSMIIDGKPGGYTLTAYRNAPTNERSAVDNVMAALGLPGSMTQANQEYVKAMQNAEQLPNSSTSSRAIFDLQIVPAVTREARRLNLDPVNYITHLCLETGYGKSIPVFNGRSTYNAAGIKAKSVGQSNGAKLRTTEFVGGKEVKIIDSFAVFPDADAFAKAYFDYLLNGPSARRYKGLTSAKTPLEYGTILQHGGYATDPKYAEKFAATARTVANRYSLA